MGRNDIPIARVELPNDWTPEGLICAVVPVPADPQYSSILVGLIDMLRWSALFERDPTRTGAATVARTWAAALNAMPITFDDCEDLMARFQLRQNPENACQLQQSLDDGETWFLFTNCINLSSVPPKSRYAPISPPVIRTPIF